MQLCANMHQSALLMSHYHILFWVYDESELGKEENHFKNSEVLLRKILFLGSSVPSIVRIHSLSSSSPESSAFCVLSHNVIILTEIPVRSAGTLLYMDWLSQFTSVAVTVLLLHIRSISEIIVEPVLLCWKST